MKILLQNTQTLLYLRPDDSWTKSQSEARNFQHSQKAIEFAHERNITDVYIAVKFLDGESDIVAPVPKRPQAKVLQA